MTNDDLDELDRHFLPADEVAERYRSYVEALEAEIDMAESVVTALDEGVVDVPDLHDAMVPKTPIERWEWDQWEDRPDDYDPSLLDIPAQEDDDGRE